MEPTKPAIGPISPELVLVDPDLAAGARAALPDYPWPAPVRIEPREPTRHRRIPVAATFSFLSFAALVGILGVSLLPTRDQPTFAAEGQRIQPAAPSPTPGVSPQRTAPSPSAGASPRPAAPQGKRPAAPQRKNPRTKKLGGPRRSPAAKPVPSGTRKLPQFKPARTFAWVSQARAAYYQVALFRNGRRVYQTRTRAPRLTLPRRVRFTARRLPLDGSACNPGPERHAARGSDSRLHLQSGPRLSSCSRVVAPPGPQSSLGGATAARVLAVYALLWRSGRVAQRESARFTRGRSLVRSQSRPLGKASGG